MSTPTHFQFLKRNAFYVATFFLFIGAAVYSALIPQDYGLTALSGILALFVFSELVDRRNYSEKLERAIQEELPSRLTFALRGGDTRMLSDSRQIYQYLMTHVTRAEHIRETTIGAYKPRVWPERHRYYQARNRYLSKSTAVCRQLITVEAEDRLRNFTKDIKELEGRQYYVAYVPDLEGSTRFLNFSIYSYGDSQDLIVGWYHTPAEPTFEEKYIVISHPAVVKMFSDYFDSMWIGAKKLNEAGLDFSAIKELASRFHMDITGRKSAGVCKRCGKPLYHFIGESGSFLGCSGFPDCLNTLAKTKAQYGQPRADS